MGELESATRLFGWVAVRQALDNRKVSQSYSLSYPLSVSKASTELRAKLRESEYAAIAYCHSLDRDLKQCLICCLVGDVSAKNLELLGIKLDNM